MKNLLETLNEQFEVFKKESELQVDKTNKAAGARARKASLAIEKMMKDFRKKSLDSSK